MSAVVGEIKIFSYYKIHVPHVQECAGYFTIYNFVLHNMHFYILALGCLMKKTFPVLINKMYATIVIMKWYYNKHYGLCSHLEQF